MKNIEKNNGLVVNGINPFPVKIHFYYQGDTLCEGELPKSIIINMLLCSPVFSENMELIELQATNEIGKNKPIIIVAVQILNNLPFKQPLF
jgi:hypothetical protein